MLCAEICQKRGGREKGSGNGGVDLLTCKQLRKERCPCQDAVSSSLGGVYMSMSEDDVNPESLSISSLLSLFNRSVTLWHWWNWRGAG